MATDAGRTTDALDFLERLEREPEQFDFFHALRCLECLHHDRPRIGEALHAREDPVRLGQQPSVSFSPSTLSRFERAAGGEPARLTVNFFGLLGPNGPLPLHLTEFADERIRHHRDPTFAAFLDLFNHRLMSLFYRAWASAEPTVQLDRRDSDRFSAHVGSMFGLGLPTLRDRDAMPDAAKLYFTGRFVPQTRNAEGLRAILIAFFEAPVKVHELVGHWLTLPHRSQWRLGESERTGLLGHSVVLGERVWNCQHKFRLVIGPLTYAAFERFLPGRDGIRRVLAIVRNYVGDELRFDLKLRLARDEVPRLRLDGVGQLGWNTWLTGDGISHDADDLVLDAVREVSAAARAHRTNGAAHDEPLHAAVEAA